MSVPKPSTTDEPTLDPVFQHSRREGCEILVSWAVALLWTILYCSAYAYERTGEEIELIWGVPSWVFWGVAVPWVVSSVFTLVYSSFRMRDDPLGEQQALSSTPSDETES